MTLKALSLGIAAMALATGATLGTIATAASLPLPTVATQAPTGTSSGGSGGSGDTSTSTSTATNSANTNAFGQQVVKQVATCKTQAAAAGTHGIGQCVSGWVTKNNPGASHHTH